MTRLVFCIALFLVACDTPTDAEPASAAVAALAPAAASADEPAADPAAEPTAEAAPTSAPTAEAEQGAQPQPASTPIIDHDVVTVTGETVSLDTYRGKVLLIVNTASACGYTPQLEGLQQLQERYADQGFTVLGFPCNDFGGQAPGTGADMAEFCTGEYGTSFPSFERVDILGDSPAPLYAALQNETADGISGAVAWNFTKFLVGTDGLVLARFEPPVTPMSDEITRAIEAALP